MIIGIGGEKKHGKDTVARYLVENYGYQQKAFADNLKQICAKAFDIPLEDMYDESKKELPFPALIIANHMVQMSPIYAMLAESYSISSRQMDAVEVKFIEKQAFTSIRDILQFVGTNILRDVFDASYHYNSVSRPFKSVEKGVVSDVRFKNERENLRRDFNAKLFLVVRPGLEKNSSSNHASENSLGQASEYDFMIINDGTLEDLYRQVDAVMQTIVQPLPVSGA